MIPEFASHVRALSFLCRAFCRVLQLIRLSCRTDTDLAIEVDVGEGSISLDFHVDDPHDITSSQTNLSVHVLAVRIEESTYELATEAVR